MRQIFFVILLFLVSFNGVAQKNVTRFAGRADITIDSTIRKHTANSCSKAEYYIPDTLHPELTPMRTVRINFHIIQDANGEHNFSESEGRKFIHELVESANSHLASNAQMNLPKENSTAALPIPYRYVITGDPANPKDDGIYFHRDDTLFAMNKKSKKKDNVYDKRQYDTYGFQKGKVINIFLIEHYPDSVASSTYKASNDGVGTGAWVKLVGSYQLWKHPLVTENGDTMKYGSWNLATLMNHELGHCFGLSHSWNSDDGCDDTPKSPGCWNFGPPPCEICSNNMMDYNAYQNALTPCQIGRECMNFFRDKSARDYLIPDWCTYSSEKTMTISDETEWFGSLDLFGDLVVENNATLTIHCMISMPPGSRIILNPKATLILDGCTITCRCDEGEWEGVEITTTKKFKPVIMLKNRAKVDRVRNTL